MTSRHDDRLGFAASEVAKHRIETSFDVPSLFDRDSRLSLPGEFVQRLGEIVAPEDWEGVLDSFSATKAVYARVNSLLVDPDALVVDSEFAELTPQRFSELPATWRFNADQREALTQASATRDGRLYIQRLSSQLAAPALKPQPGEQVLDLAAAPGGKTLHLAALMGNEGRLSAVEPIRPRMYRLADNLKRAGVTIARTYLMDGRKVGRKTPDRFDRVLLDAPCSSEARLRSEDPDSNRFWSLRKIKEQSRKQRGLLLAALQATRPGGRVLYCTCSFAPEENEAVVDYALQQFEPGAELLPLELPLVESRPALSEWSGEAFDSRVALARRVLPSAETDGFFLALLQRH